MDSTAHHARSWSCRRTGGPGRLHLRDRAAIALAPGAPPGTAPAVALARARAGVPARLPDLPDDRHDHPQLPGRGAARTSSGSTTTSGSSATHDALIGPPQQRPVGRLPDRCSRSASACWSRSSSTGSATSRSPRRVIFLPLAISFVAAGVIWKFMYEYQPPGTTQTGTAQRASSAWSGSGRSPGSRSTVPPQHLRPDLRHGLDVDRLRHGHPLGRAQGHQPRAARGGPRRRRQRVAGLPRDHRSRC